MIKFIKENDLLILNYEPRDGTKWIIKKFNENEEHTISRTFTISKNNIFNNESEDSDDVISFIIAELDKSKNYYKFHSDILSIDFDLYIQSDIKIDKSFFIAYNNISIFRKINTVINEKELFIGTNENSNFPFLEFQKLIKSFPNSTEIKKYSNARIDLIVKEYFGTKENFEEKYQQYMNKKVALDGQNILEYFREYEQYKYKRILKKLKSMLKNEKDYNEANWQKEILQIIQLIYSKYILAFENVTIKDTDFAKSKYLDFMLIDSNGHIDIVEIKKPFSDKNIVSSTQYRNNHVPLRELSGSIMQVEKYIYNLNRWGERGEKELTKVYKQELPEDFKIKITNPSGIIIMGREINLTSTQKNDLEIIKRKYKNIIDIITYDELIQRLENIIESQKKNS